MTSLIPQYMTVKVQDRRLMVHHQAQISPHKTLAMFLSRFFEVFPNVLPQFIKMQQDPIHEKEFVAHVIHAMQDHKTQNPEFNCMSTLNTIALFTRDPTTTQKLHELGNIIMQSKIDCQLFLSLMIAATVHLQ